MTPARAFLVWFVAAGAAMYATGFAARTAGGIALATMGLLAVFFRRILAEGQNRVNRPFKALSVWGEARPQLFFIFGVGLIILGLAAIFEPWLKP